MNWDQIEGKWHQMKGQVRTAFGELTDNDIAEMRGRREELVGKLQERYGYAKAEAQRRVDEFAAKL